MSDIDFFSSMSVECTRAETEKRCRPSASRLRVCATFQISQISPGDKAPGTRDVEHLYSRFQVLRRVDGEDVESMRSAARNVKAGRHPLSPRTH